LFLKKGEKLSESELKAFLGGKLAEYKVPKIFKFFEHDIPKNVMGKVNKKELLKSLQP